MLTATSAFAANGTEDQGEVPQAALTNKPVVSIQGNVVVDNGKPTGFYELALCVRSARRIARTDDGVELTEADYAADLAANPEHETDGTYTVTYYPFASAAATVNVNADALTAVNWDVEEVTYATWDGASYAAHDTDYPRGVDTSGLDPELWPATGPDAFPDVTLARQAGTQSVRVALDAEGDRSAFTAAAQVEDYRVDTVNNISTALVTLSAHAADNKPVIFTTDTPVVVVRFSYDLKRFPKTVVNEAYNASSRDQEITGDANTSDGGFWLGLDRGSMGNDQVSTYHKTPLTWLANTDLSGDFSYSDERAAASSAGQVVWTKIAAGLSGGFEETEYYYYLGAENPNKEPQNGIIQVDVNGAPTTVTGVAMPDTLGKKVLTAGTEENPDIAPNGKAPYTYFVNLLKLKDQSLKLKMVNEPTFRRPTGISGPQILFYDWDDTLIGSLMVTKGDVRAQVNAYLERTLVHPDLRSDSPFMADESGSGGMSQEEKYASLQRDYTYRGKYAYTVGGDDDTLGVADGTEYPLTNKLDYVFTKRVNTAVTQTENGSQVQYVHPYSLDDPELDAAQEDGALYPWVYGWAVVEDTRAFNGNKAATGTQGQWKVMHDAAKIEDVWTTMGTGELGTVRPTSIDVPIPPTITAVDPSATRTAPVFLAENDPAWTDGTKGDDYAYTLSGTNGYLRFADFSDITAEMDRYTNKDTLIVKAIYEPGDKLMPGNTYTAITEPAYTKWNNVAANAGAAYRVQMTVERSYEQDGEIRGTTRIRMPAVQQDTTIDSKWINDAEKGVNNDLTNTSFDVSKSKGETLYTQVDVDNGEQITFSLTLSPRQNRVDYVLVELYDANFVAGTQRSTTNNDYKDDPLKFIPDNYNYLAGADSNTQDDLYDSDFSTKEGSHGFVLFGTLGHFLEQATKCNHGEVARGTYDNTVTSEIAYDANLRMDLTGRQPNFLDDTTLQDVFIAAAARCEVHKNDPGYDCWDENLDAAKLTYHQAQWFLIDYQANPGCDIRKAADADAAKLSFCHYHITCSGGHVPVAPTTWKELVDKLKEYNTAADGSDDKEFALADLEDLELANLESMTSIRSNAAGRKYTVLNVFLNALIAAEDRVRTAGLDVNWVNLQYAILHASADDPGDMRDEAQEQYWWYAGATTAPKINDFTALLAAAETIRKPVTLKDGDNTFYPKSALNAAQYPEQATGYLSAANPTRAQRNAWVALTDNLVPEHAEVDQDPDGVPNSGDEYTDFSYGRYPDMAAFLTDFNTAYDEVLTDIDNGADTPADNDEWWQQLQTKMLRDKDPADNLGDNLGDGSNRFWWKSGNTPFRITNLSTLLECARRLSKPPTDENYASAYTEWQRITVEEIESVAVSQGMQWKGSDAAHPLYPTPGSQLGASESAQKDAILAQLQAVVKNYDAAVAKDPTIALNWARIQYMLLNPTDTEPTVATIMAQQTYYWWKDGNTAGTTVTLSAAGGVEANLQALMNATYRADFNDPGVTQSILDATTAAGGSFWDFTRLTTQKVQGDHELHENDQYTGPDELKDVTPYAYPGTISDDVEDFLDMLAGFRDAAKSGQGMTDPYGVPDFVWHQLQYYILNSGAYLPASDQAIRDLRDKEKALAGDYWWYYADERHIPEPPAADLTGPAAPMVDLFETIAVEGRDLYEILGEITPDMLTDWGFEYMDAGHSIPMDFDNFAMFQLEYLYWDLNAEGYFMGEEKPSWAQMMYYLVSAYEDDPDSLEGFGVVATHEDAVQGLLDFGWTAADCPPGALNIPEGASLFALDMEELTQLEAPLANDRQEAAPEAAETETVEDIRAQIEALERELEALKERLAALEEAAGETEAPAAARPVSTPARPAVPVRPEPAPEPTPEEPEVPAEPEPTPAPGHDERAELPLGEEAVQLPEIIEVEGLDAGYATVDMPATVDIPAAVDTPATLAALPPRREQAWKSVWA